MTNHEALEILDAIIAQEILDADKERADDDAEFADLIIAAVNKAKPAIESLRNAPEGAEYGGEGFKALNVAAKVKSGSIYPTQAIDELALIRSTKWGG